MTDDSDSTNSISSIFSGFYSHFILRDLLAKITPGSIVLLTIFSTLFTLKDGLMIFDYLKNFFTWSIFIIVSWLIGFAIQGVGEYVGIIRYYPKKVGNDKLDDSEWYQTRLKFLKNAGEFEKREEERLCVVKEACGNGCVCLIISLILVILNVIQINFVESVNWFQVGFSDSMLNHYLLNHNVLYFYLLLIFIFILMVSLWYLHKKNIMREYKYLNEYIKQNKL
jgi:hypothetical protein